MFMPKVKINFIANAVETYGQLIMLSSSPSIILYLRRYE